MRIIPPATTAAEGLNTIQSVIHVGLDVWAMQVKQVQAIDTQLRQGHVALLYDGLLAREALDSPTKPHDKWPWQKMGKPLLG